MSSCPTVVKREDTDHHYDMLVLYMHLVGGVGLLKLCSLAHVSRTGGEKDDNDGMCMFGLPVT